MKSARALVPILIVVLLVCTMALTFAWFAQTMEEVKVGNAFTIGDTNYVYLTDGELPEGAPQTTIQATLIGERYNGELGFKEDGTAYPSGDLDVAYVAEYKIGVFMQGSEDLTLTVRLDGVTVMLSDYVTGVSVGRLYRAVLSKLTDEAGEQLFADVSALDGHIGTATADADGGWTLADPADGEAWLYTLDGTSATRPVALKLDEQTTRSLFRISVARVTNGEPGEYGGEVLFTYPGDVMPDLADCREHELRLKIEFGYADENDRGIPFPFADEAFRGCTFGFEVTARAL